MTVDTRNHNRKISNIRYTIEWIHIYSVGALIDRSGKAGEGVYS